MNKKYIVPVTRFAQAELESWIATSLAGTDPDDSNALFKYDEEVDLSGYFEGGWN